MTDDLFERVQHCLGPGANAPVAPRACRRHWSSQCDEWPADIHLSGLACSVRREAKLCKVWQALPARERKIERKGFRTASDGKLSGAWERG